MAFSHFASPRAPVGAPQLTSPKRAGNCDKLADWHYEPGESGLFFFFFWGSDAYRFLLGKITGGAEDNNDRVVLELDDARK